MDFDFHWWMLLPLIPLAGLAFVAFKVYGIRRRSRTFLQLTRAERLRFAGSVLRDPDLPPIPRVLAAAAGYLALPIDLIPDFVPIIGHADDFLVVTLMLVILNRTLTRNELDAIVNRSRHRSVPRGIPAH